MLVASLNAVMAGGTPLVSVQWAEQARDEWNSEPTLADNLMQSEWRENDPGHDHKSNSPVLN